MSENNPPNLPIPTKLLPIRPHRLRMEDDRHPPHHRPPRLRRRQLSLSNSPASPPRLNSQSQILHPPNQMLLPPQPNHFLSHPFLNFSQIPIAPPVILHACNQHHQSPTLLNLFPTHPTPLLWASLQIPPTPESLSLMHQTLKTLASFHLSLHPPAQVTQIPPRPPSPEHPTSPPPTNPSPNHLNLVSLGHDMALTKNRLTTFTVHPGVVGLQLELRFCQILENPKEIFSYLTPLSLTEIWALDQSQHWNDWEDFIPKSHREGKEVPIMMPDLNIKIALWNIRGGNTDSFIPHALTIIQLQHPTIFIVLETKADENRARTICRKLGFNDFRAIPSSGLRAGIWLFWKNCVDLILYTEKRNYFHSLFHFNPHKPDVLITGLHAPSTSAARRRF